MEVTPLPAPAPMLAAGAGSCVGCRRRQRSHFPQNDSAAGASYDEYNKKMKKQTNLLFCYNIHMLCITGYINNIFFLYNYITLHTIYNE